MEQLGVVMVLVALAAAYSIWYVLPATLRPRLGRLHGWFAKTGGCGASACQDCRGCAGAAPSASASDPARAAEQPIRFYSRP